MKSARLAIGTGLLAAVVAGSVLVANLESEPTRAATQAQAVPGKDRFWLPMADARPTRHVLATEQARWQLMGTTDNGAALIVRVVKPAALWCGGSSAKVTETKTAVTVTAFALKVRCPETMDLGGNSQLQPFKLPLAAAIDGRNVQGPGLTDLTRSRLTYGPRPTEGYLVPGVIGLSAGQAGELWSGLQPKVNRPSQGSWVSQQNPREWKQVAAQPRPAFSFGLNTR